MKVLAALVLMAVATVAVPSCLRPGCVKGSGIKTYVDAPNTVRDPQWDLCLGSTCEALVYGGHRGRGTQQGQNEWGNPSPYTKTYRVPLMANETVVAARINVFGSVDSGYTYPNEPPYVVTVTVNGAVVGDHLQLVGLLRNPTWLSLPGPPPADGNLRNWTYEIPPQYISRIGAENNVTYDLVTPGWMTFEHTKFMVDVCSWQCTCYDNDLYGHWTGSMCDRCKSGWAGAYCNDDISTSGVGSDDSSSTSSQNTRRENGLYAAIGILAAVAAIGLGAAFIMWRRIQSMSMMTSLGTRVKPDSTAKIAPAAVNRGPEGSPA
jgi:hypothetical protein